ncbi:protein of unknown function [Methanocaldococcus lauensis]|nr:protein of unknown function [Methanocaldococcus lauensis]
MHPGYPNRAESYGFKTQTPKRIKVFKFFIFNSIKYPYIEIYKSLGYII